MQEFVQQLRAEYRAQLTQQATQGTESTYHDVNAAWEPQHAAVNARPSAQNAAAASTGVQQQKPRKQNWQFNSQENSSIASKVLQLVEANVPVKLPALARKPDKAHRNRSQSPAATRTASPDLPPLLTRGGVIPKTNRGLLDKPPPPPAVGKRKDGSGYAFGTTDDRVLSKYKTSRAAVIPPLPTLGRAAAAHPPKATAAAPLPPPSQQQAAVHLTPDWSDDGGDDEGMCWDITSRPYADLHPGYLPRPRFGSSSPGSRSPGRRHSTSPRHGSHHEQQRDQGSPQQLLLKVSPRVAFNRAERWPGPQVQRSPSPVAANPAAHRAHNPPTAPAAPTLLNLDAAYQAVTTRSRAAQFSQCPRFPRSPSPGHAPDSRSRSPVATWVQRPVSAPAQRVELLQCSPSPQPPPDTAGVEAALDFVKTSHVPSVSIAPPKVKDQIHALLAARRAARAQQQEAAAKLLRAAEEAAVGSQAAAAALATTPSTEALFSDVDLNRQQPVQGSPSQAQYNPRGIASSSLELSWIGQKALTQPLTRRSLSAQPTRPSILNPQYTLIERTPRTVRFSSPPRPKSTGRFISRDPGPGSYSRLDETTLTAALSTAKRLPVTVFGTAPREVTSPPLPRHNPAAIIAQRHRQPLAALDAILPRAPVAVISTAGVGDRTSASQKLPETAQHVDGGDTHVAAAPQILHISYSLVEPRVRHVAVIPTAGAVPKSAKKPLSAEAEQQLLAYELAIDPWKLDAAVRVRKPAWYIPAAVVVVQRPLPPPQLLYPNWDVIKPRADVGIPLFARFLNTHRAHDQAAGRRRGVLTPAVGQYDLHTAWVFLQKHVPQVVMQLAETRWRTSLADGLSRGGDQLVLELSVILDTVRGVRAPAWTFRPLPSHPVRQAGRRDRPGHGYGPMLSWEAEQAWDFVLQRRGRGVLTWEGAVGRDDTCDDARAREEMHLAPGTYDIRYGQVERRVLGRRFSTYLGHDIFSSSDDEEGSGGSSDESPLPEGAVLKLDVLAARDAIRKRPHHVVHMQGMQGRDVGILGAGDPHGAYTLQLEPLGPDGDRVLSQRPRAPQVIISVAGDDSQEPKSPGAKLNMFAEARRGPGAYDVTLGDLGRGDGRAADFGRGPGHTVHTAGVDTSLEGQRLTLEPDVDVVRPRAPAHTIPPLPSHHALQLPGALPQDLYKDAAYDLAYDMNTVRPQPPRPVDWSLQPPVRGAHSPGKRQPISPPRDYHIEDIPLHVLAGYGGTRGVLDWSRMAPAAADSPGAGLPNLEGDRLVLDPLAAYRALHRKGLGLPDMTKQQGRGGLDEPDSDDASAWVTYHPSFTLVRPRPASPPAFDHVTGRARQASPPPTTLDIDGGVYNPVHAQLWPNPRAGVSWSVAGPRFSPPRDQDTGNVLSLNPVLPEGWRRPAGTEPDTQPFGMTRARWSDPGAPRDDGNVLRLRIDADDMAMLRRRPTLANAPATAFGAMTASRYEQVVKPNENVPVRQVYRPPEGQRIETSLMTQLPANKALELLQHDPTNPMVLSALRRERVWARIERRIAEEYGAGAAGDTTARGSPGATHRSPGVLQGVLPHLDDRPTAVGRKEWAVRQALMAKGPRDIAALRQIQQEDIQAQEKAAAQAPKPLLRPRNLQGAFYLAHNPKAPPAVPPPVFVHKHGVFSQVQGGHSIVQETYPSLLVNRGMMDQQRMAGVARGAAPPSSPQRAVPDAISSDTRSRLIRDQDRVSQGQHSPGHKLQIKLPPIREPPHAGVRGRLAQAAELARFRGGMTYESDCDRPTTQQMQASLCPPQLGALKDHGAEAARRLERLRKLAAARRQT